MRSEGIWTARARVAALLALGALAGCASVEVRQRQRFVDELGRFATVRYCVSSKDHASTFVSPANGRELEMKSNLLVKVDLYDEHDFTAYQTMNPFPSGTMYTSDDEEWKFHAHGFTCEAYQRNEETGRYDTRFQGVICPDDGSARKEESKWKKVKAKPPESVRRDSPKK